MFVRCVFLGKGRFLRLNIDERKKMKNKEGLLGVEMSEIMRWIELKVKGHNKDDFKENLYPKIKLAKTTFSLYHYNKNLDIFFFSLSW